jgi:hypothetical protein
MVHWGDRFETVMNFIYKRKYGECLVESQDFDIHLVNYAVCPTSPLSDSCAKIAKRLLRYFDGLHRAELYSAMEHVSGPEILFMLDTFPARLAKEFFALFCCTETNAAFFPTDQMYKLAANPYIEANNFKQINEILTQ